VRTFTEIQLKDADGKVSIPDGAILVERGKTPRALLVEVKTGEAELAGEQVGRYLDHARSQGVAGVSRSPPPWSVRPRPGVDPRRTDRLSLDHEASGASGFTDMGDKWVRVRHAAHNGTLRAADPEAREVVERCEQFGEYLALGLAQDLGRDVTVLRPRKLDAEQRRLAQVKALAEAACLSTTIKVLDAAAPVDLRADLRARRVAHVGDARRTEGGAGPCE